MYQGTYNLIHFIVKSYARRYNFDNFKDDPYKYKLLYNMYHILCTANVLDNE